MKKILLLLSIFTIASCGSTHTSQENVTIPTDPNPDVTALFVQACQNKESSCKQLLCNKKDGRFICSDNPLGANTNCSTERSYDDIMNKYTICSENDELLTYQVFNYSENKNDFFDSMTASELENKVQEELTKVEEGGESEWLGTFLASAGGALLGGIIANAIFGGGSAQVPQKPSNIENNRTIDKNSLTQTQEQSKTETQSRTEKRKAEFQKRVNAAKQKIAENKKTQTTKKASTKRKRR